MKIESQGIFNRVGGGEEVGKTVRKSGPPVFFFPPAKKSVAGWGRLACRRRGGTFE